MITGIFHEGSGLGNQLHRYVATRVLALDKGYEFGMINPSLFKGQSFMKLEMGNATSMPEHFFNEKKVIENGIAISSYDPEINFVEDNTIIDGEFQDPRYFEHRMSEVDEWLQVEPLDLPEDLCVIGFRAGEYALYPDLFLPQEFWIEAMEEMEKINPKMRYEVHTDDPKIAREFFLDAYPIIHDIGINWRSVRYADYLIIANSSFYILPALLNGYAKKIIAPRYWARHNLKVWSMPQNYYKQFTYI